MKMKQEINFYNIWRAILPLIYHKIYFLLPEKWGTIFHMDNNPFIPRCLSLNIIAYRWNSNRVFLERGSVKELWQVENVNIFISVCFEE